MNPETELERVTRERDRYHEAIRWALGECGAFNEVEPPPLAGKYPRRFYWRTELRERAQLSPQGERSDGEDDELLADAQVDLLAKHAKPGASTPPSTSPAGEDDAPLKRPPRKVVGTFSMANADALAVAEAQRDAAIERAERAEDNAKVWREKAIAWYAANRGKPSVQMIRDTHRHMLARTVAAFSSLIDGLERDTLSLRQENESLKELASISAAKEGACSDS